MASKMLLLCFSAISAASASAISPRQSARPTVHLANGSYYGVHSPTYDQDFFLGVPYAEPPLGDLRFRVPRPLNATWTGERNATEYSPQCFGYGSDTWVLGNYVSEDCLTLNVIRPHGVSPDANLPVAVWIHGGGLTNGGSSDPRYNLSFVVEQSVKMNQPILAVSMNYRLHAWGFLFSREIKSAGVGNLGLRDQRQAMRWVKENIASFGGDPAKVTLWGESAGARSIGSQMVAYDGRDDDGLFRGAILQSGTGLITDFGETDRPDAMQKLYDSIVAGANCSSARDTLQCLREVPTWDLSRVMNATAAPAFAGSIDGDFLTAPHATLISSGKFVNVPIVIGTNFDEGTAFGQPGVDTTSQWEGYLASQGASGATTTVLSALYPDIPRVGIPATLPERPSGSLRARFGAQWKRVAAFTGDNRQHAPRRWWSREWARRGGTAYTYRFNVLVNGLPGAVGSTHFQEVAFVFNNVGGLGYQNAVAVNPFEGKPETFGQLAGIMSRMWVSFVAHLDPNYSGATCTRWPKYTLDDPKNMGFDVNVTSLAYVEPDTFRTEQIEYQIGKLWGGALGGEE